MDQFAPWLMSHFPLVAAGISFVVGLGVAAVGLRAFLRARASASWPSADGEIMQSEVVSGAEDTRIPKIVYEHLVNGQRHTGDRLSAGHQNFGSTETSARARVERYPAGARVKVFYNPAAPAQCALEPGVGFASVILLIIGLAVAFVSSPVEYFILSRSFHP